MRSRMCGRPATVGDTIKHMNKDEMQQLIEDLDSFPWASWLTARPKG